MFAVSPITMLSIDKLSPSGPKTTSRVWIPIGTGRFSGRHRPPQRPPKHAPDGDSRQQSAPYMVLVSDGGAEQGQKTVTGKLRRGGLGLKKK